MSRSYQPIELNTFVGGLVTEASPLTFPQNASLDETNFVLNKDGSRSRRLGMDYEDNYVINNSPIGLPPNGERLIVNSFKWTNAGGNASKTIIVIQIANNLTFFDDDITPLSRGAIYNQEMEVDNGIIRFSFASVDGKLVVATGNKSVGIFTYTEKPQSVTFETGRLLIRDLFGIDDIVNGVDLRSGTGISKRPVNDGSGLLRHMYNLKNQTWAIPRPGFHQGAQSNTPRDVIEQFFQFSNGIYPSNADSVLPNLYPNTDSSSYKTLVRFDSDNALANPPSNSYAPIGYFIIDALDRGDSRKAEVINLATKFPNSGPGDTAVIANVINKDSTPGGASCICEYAGRVWYSGFPGDVEGGDNHSPKMASYVLFSQLVRDSVDAFACYQAADPTDKNDSALVDTDGGFIRVQGAYDISSMVNLGNLLLVFASNGVWSISGGNSYGFTATNYKVDKITNSGCISPGSIVVVENSVFYWSRDGIYNISPNQYGDYVATNTSIKTIQRYYNAIPETIAKYSEGVYDSYEKQIKWLFYNAYGLDQNPTELILDTNIGAYYKHEIKPFDVDGLQTRAGWPIVVKGIQTNPYSYSYESQEVTVDSSQVVVGTDDVFVDTRQEITGTKEVIYLILTENIESQLGYTFGSYKQPYHYDWTEVDGVGIDAPAYLITGYLSGGDYQRNKQVVYLTMHFKSTETYPTPL